MTVDHDDTALAAQLAHHLTQQVARKCLKGVSALFVCLYLPTGGEGAWFLMQSLQGMETDGVREPPGAMVLRHGATLPSPG